MNPRLSPNEIFAQSERRAGEILAAKNRMLIAAPERSERQSALDWGIARARHFFKQALHIAGFWSDFHSIAAGGRDWISAYVAWSLLEDDALAAQDVEAAITVLLADQYPSGAWGYRPGLPADMDSTSWAALCLRKFNAGWDANRTLDILIGHQNARSGGIQTYLGPQFGIGAYVGARPGDDLSGWCSAHVCITAVAVQAMLACGLAGDHPALESCVAFIRQQQRPDGHWDAYWYHGKTYATTQCVRALLQSGAKPAEMAFTQALRWLRHTQLADGSWNDGAAGTAGRVADTALAVCAWLALDPGPAPTLAKAIAWLLNEQWPDGSWNALPILQLPAANEHEPWQIREWPEIGGSLTQGICIADRNRYFTTATALQALSAWRKSQTLEANA
ncbi:MAG: prenyltransferase/squalene oxidase repeat-containing protein [Chloroflexota bacterium]